MKLLKLLLPLIVVLNFLTCLKDTDENIENAIIPFKIGNKWIYYREFYTDSSIISSNTNINTIIKIDTLIIDTLQDSIIAYKFESIYIEDTLIDTGAQWYNTENEILHSYGYVNAGVTFGLPRKRAINTISFKGYTFNSPLEITQFLLGYKSNNTAQCIADTNFYYDPVEVYHYPLEIDKEWYYREEIPFPIFKKVIVKESITVKAGEFKCYKIRWFWDIDGDGVWDTDIDGYEYISINGYGLIKMIFYIEIIDGVSREVYIDDVELSEYTLSK